MPLLPWEVVERIIEYASDDLELLRSFSLTCRQLRPRSFSLIVARYIFLGSRDRVSGFYDFLLENAELRSSIQSLTISPADFSPVPLVNMLSRLSTLIFVSPGSKENVRPGNRPAIKLHPAILNCYHSFGKRIHTLSLSRLSFRTSSDLFRLLFAFPNVRLHSAFIPDACFI